MTDAEGPMPTAAPDAVSKRSLGFLGAVVQLTGSNFLLVILAFISSPILARALHPSGRGEVAAVFAIVSVAPWVSEIGLTAFISVDRSRRTHPLGLLLGSTLPVAMVFSGIIAGCAIPVAHLLGRGRPDVVRFIELGLYLLPIGVFSGTLNGVAIAEGRWTLITLSRVLSSGGTTLTIVVLSLTKNITVPSVAITYIAWGSFSSAPLLLCLRGARPWAFSPALARTGAAFGVRSWLATIANTANGQLDQVLMAGLVSSRQLGLYSLAVTLSLAANSLVTAISTALTPRVAAGDVNIAPRACRLTLFMIVIFSIGMGATSPWTIPFIFGSPFRAAIPMLLILLVAGIFLVPINLLGSTLTASNNPSATARGQLAGLIVTVPSLILLLPSLGGVGAALTSLLSYLVTFGVIIVAASRTLRLPLHSFLFVQSSDLRSLTQRVRIRSRSASTL